MRKMKTRSRPGRLRRIAGFVAVITVALALVSSANPLRAKPRLLQPMPGTPQAPELALPDLDGQIWRLTDFKGKVVIVNFWATWCPPCRFEIPSMQRAWVHLKDKGVVMLAVHLGGNEDKIWAFLTDYGVEFPVLTDKTSSTARAWRTIGLPTTFIVGPRGRIIYRAVDERERDDPALMKTLLSLLD